MIKNWIVRWTIDGKEYREEFEMRLLAEIKCIQLESYGIHPILMGNVNANDGRI